MRFATARGPSRVVFNFSLQHAILDLDTTGFSRVVLQISTYAWPRDDTSRTPPASAAWCFNFNL